MIRNLVLAFLLASAPAWAKQWDNIDPPAGELRAPVLPEGVPAGGLGCVVVGYFVRPDGSITGGRILQGAYASAVPQAVRDGFQARALEAAEGWRFVHREARPDAVHFGMQLVGFRDNAGAAIAVVGAEGQDERVRAACGIRDLADWGDRNAIPVAQAVRDDRMLARRPGDPHLYWTVAGDMTPPRYPGDAIRAGIEACVVVGFKVGVDGVPGDFRIMSTDLRGVQDKRYREAFEAVALQAASTWRYAPGPDNLVRMPEFMQVPVDFRLGGEPTFGCKQVDLFAE